MMVLAPRKKKRMFPELVAVGMFSAAGIARINPTRIPEGIEYLEILTAGSVQFEDHGIWREYRRGTIFWHASGEYTICRTTPEDPYQCWTLRFRSPYCTRPSGRICQWSDERSLDPIIEESLRRFHEENIDREYLGGYLYSRLRWEAYLSGRRKDISEYPRNLRKALAAMRNDETFPRTVCDLAEAAGVSEAYLYTLFRKYLKSSPHQYLLHFRLRQARVRLAGTGDNIKTIAEECGFENLESFYRAFRRFSGITPGEYRKRQRLSSDRF